MSTKPTTVPPKTLSQAILAADISFIPNNIQGWNGSNLSAANFGTRAFGAFISANGQLLELFEWDPATVADPEIDFVTRGLDYEGGVVAVTANKQDWPAGTTVLLGSDTPQLLNLYISTSMMDTDVALTANSDVKIATQKATKSYGDGLAAAGAADAAVGTKGISKMSVAPAVAGTPIAVGTNDPRVPTQGEKDALDGTGVPSSSNKFVTEDDPDFTDTVKLTGAQNVDGVKTFTSIPVLPGSDPTTANQAARKSYVDGLVADVSGSVVDGGTTIHYMKRGNKLYYGLYADSGSRFNADGTTLARLALKLGITISSNESVGLPSGPNTGVILYSAGWNPQNSAPTICTWIIST